jgi:hypothetical protein
MLSAVVLLGLLLVPAAASALKFEPAPGTPLVGHTTEPEPSVTMPDGYVPVDVSAGYFNDDAYEDIALVSDVSKDIYVYLGQADGSLEPSAGNPIGSNSIDSGNRVTVHAADLDGDGDTDLATVDLSFPTRIEVYLNRQVENGNGHEAFGTTPDSSLTLDPEFPGLGGYVSSYFGDKDGDGDDDLVLGLTSNSYIYLDDNNGEFEIPTGPVSAGGSDAADRGIYSTTIGDFNGDGDGDVVMVSEPGYHPEDPQPVRLLYAAANGDSTFANPTEITPGTADKYISNVRSVDLNGDQYDDLIFKQEADFEDRTMIALGSATGPVLQEPTESTPAVAGGIGPSFGDFNGDGNEDLALPQFGDEGFQIALGDGAGHLALDMAGPFALAPIGANEFYPQRSASLDVNGDGRLDFAAISGHSGDDNQGRGVAVMLAKRSSGISVSPESIDFGQVPGDAELIAPVPVTIKSNGDLPLDLGDIGYSGPDTSGFLLDRGDCPNGNLATGSSCTLQVSMSQSRSGYFNGYLDISSDARADPIQIEVIGQVEERHPVPADLSLKVKSARKVKAGRKLIVTAIVRNAGTSHSVHFNLKAYAPKKRTGKVRPASLRNLSLSGGHISQFKFKVPVKRRAKGKFQVKVSLVTKGRNVNRKTVRIKILKKKRRR